MVHPLGFYLLAYKDFARAEWCLSRLRQHYPTAPIFVQVDGDDDPRYASLQETQAAEVNYGERLYLLEREGLILHRMLKSMIGMNCKSFIRMDTDTDTLRHLTTVPTADYYGTLDHQMFLQGGCVGLSLRVVRWLLQAEVFKSQKRSDVLAWSNNDEGVARRHDSGLVCFDWSLAAGMRKLGVVPTACVEIHSRWKAWDFTPGDFAFTHPVKTIPIDRSL